MKDTTKAHIAALLGNFFFGAAIVAIKHLIPKVMPSLALNVLRVGIALILFWVLYLFNPGKASIQKKHIPLFLLCGCAGVAINQILFIKGTALTSGIHASLLGLCTPIAITIIAAWLLKVKITTNKLIGLLLGVGGAATLVLVKTQTNAESDAFGDILIILNAFSYAFYLVLVAPLMQSYKPIHVIRWVFLIGSLIIIPIGFHDFTQIHWEFFNWTHWVALAFVVFGATFSAYLLIVYAIGKLGAPKVGTYIYTQPVFATITSMLLYNEQLTYIKIIAAFFIFSGVFMVNRKNSE
jgi:drug/metabolite transporter (DMT)-like permease